jgi:hypothetical protein
LCLYSEQIDNASWDKVNGSGGTAPVVTANYGISPDGTQNADRIQLARTTAADSYSYVYQTITLSASATYTVSVYLKSLSGTPTISIALDGVGYDHVVTMTTEWARYEVEIVAGGSFDRAQLLLYQAVPSTSLTADFLAWGFQVEQSSYPTSYIPTTSASATRVADTYQKAGIGNTSTAGTLFYEFGGYQPSIPANAQYLLQLFAGSSVGDAFFSDANSISIINQGANIEGRNDGFSTTLFSFTPTSATVKVALRYNGTNVVAFVNGVKQTVYSDTAVGVKNAIRVNNGEYGSQATKQLIFFPTALTDAECISLTTI